MDSTDGGCVSLSAGDGAQDNDSQFDDTGTTNLNSPSCSTPFGANCLSSSLPSAVSPSHSLGKFVVIKITISGEPSTQPMVTDGDEEDSQEESSQEDILSPPPGKRV